MQWIDENGLATWAKRLDARAFLPDMIADLIRASISDAARFRFPGGDAGQVRGWDGSLETLEAISFVPAGKSKWEFGSGAGATKASTDYNKRTGKTDPAEMAENTLVLVNLEKWDTPRELLTKWENDRRAENKWKDVRYLDAVELVHWLDLHPAVAALYARDVLGTAPKDGALSTDEFWEMYSAQFKPRLSERVIISDRQTVADSLLGKLAGPAQSFMLGAETAVEVVAFAVAAIRLANPELRRALEVRTLIVESEAAARFLSKHANLTFITTKAGDSMSGLLGDKGPTLSAATGVQARKYELLQRPSASSMVDGFVEMGLPREAGYELAQRCGRSLTILQRLIPNQPYQAPEWVQRAAELKPAFLAGGWSTNVALDRDILKDLAGLPDYDSLERVLLPTTVLADPPIDRVGEYWQVRAPVDAFSFYSSLIGDQDLQRLRDAVVRVFSHVVEAPSRDEKFSITYVSPADYSKWLRDGLALTLLIVATMDKVSGLQINNSTPQRYVDEILNGLPEWGKSHRTLVGLADQTALFAEASPNPFLTALESMLEGGEIVHIFVEQEDWIFGSRSPHLNVLWALEVLAWDPKLFARSALILAKLAELDPHPESRNQNRPINSLRSILLSWGPNTYATLKQRIACIDSVIARCPKIAWELIVKLLPRLHDSSSPTQMPKLRDVAPLIEEQLTFGLVWDSQRAIVSRAIQLAGDDEDRIVLLIKECSSFRPQDRAAVVGVVDDYLSRHQTDEENAVWSALRAEVARHEFFADADWALQEDERAKIFALLDRYRPADPLLADKDLFDEWLPHVGRYKVEGQIDPDIGRTDALDRILSREGPSGILKLAQKAALPTLIGPILGRMAIPEPQFIELLETAVEHSAPGDLAMYASAIGVERFGASWITLLQERILPRLDTSESKAQLLLGWPLNDATWDFARSLGDGTYDEYWRRTQILPRVGSVETLLRAIGEFRRMRRSLEVLGLVHRRIGELPTELIFSLLDEGLAQVVNDKVQDGTMLSYYLDATFKELGSRGDAQKADIARREYAYFPLLANEKRPLVLYELLSEDPNLFVEVLSHVFRAKDSSPVVEVDERERARGTASYRLLSSFKSLPGASGNVVDREKLDAWVDGVRASAKVRDLADIADQYVGRVLAHAPAGPDEDFWPPSAVCEVIERIASSEVENGFSIECFNKRGAFMKALHEGGQQERELSARYERWATSTAHYPRTSTMLSKIASSWLNDAAREDLRAELDKMKR